MGQYYHVVNLDKKQFLHPHKFGQGLKLLEFGASGDGVMCALALLCSNGNGQGGGDLDAEDDLIGSWAGDRIVVAGDYGDRGKWLGEYDQEQLQAVADNHYTEGYRQTEHVNLYAVACDLFEDISFRIIAIMCEDEYLRRALIENAWWWHLENVAPAVQEAARKLTPDERLGLKIPALI